MEMERKQEEKGKKMEKVIIEIIESINDKTYKFCHTKGCGLYYKLPDSNSPEKIWGNSEFKSKESNDGKFIQSGLWKYSRHPNYFGEILIWTGIAIIGISVYSGFGWLGWISPIFVFVMLNYISGVRLLEKQADERWGGNNVYQSYKSKTPVLVPYKFIKD